MNSNLALTLILLTLMFAAGVVSAAYSFALGREGLKGVTQPDTRPTNTLSNRNGSAPRRGEVMILKEQEILRQTKARMAGDVSAESIADETQEKKDQPDGAGDSKQKTSQKNAAFNNNSFTTAASFPIVSEDRNVRLEVKSVRREGNSLLLEVNLRNQGDKPVRFLYSFLDVTDDRGRSLSASAAGLPTELPSQSESFSGTINIPIALLDDVKELSLALTDYPDQRLQLKMSGIPIVN